MKSGKNNTNILNKGLVTACICYLLAVTISSFWLRTRTPYWWTVLWIGITDLLISILPLYLYNRQMKYFFRDMNFCMDEMLNMPEQITFPALASPDTIMARFQTKLERIYQLIKEAEDKTRRENEKLHTLISDISHQTKTPAANLKMHLSILADGALTETERKEFRDIAEVQADKLAFLIDSLIKLSRLETGVFQLVCRPCNLYQTLADAAGGILLKAEEKNIQVEVHCPEVLTVSHDRKWTGEAFFNLLENAVKYTPSGGTIQIFAEQWESHVKIDICDSGIGISEDLQGRIFQRFYRTPAAAGYQGAGIGLYVTREIIERQHGHIMVQSAEGKGSTFSVYLPN